MMNGLEQFIQDLVIPCNFDGNDSLGRRRHKLLRLKGESLPIGNAQTLQTGTSQYNCIKLALAQFAKAGFDIAAKRLNNRIRPQADNLGLPADARSADACSCRQSRQFRNRLTAEQNILRKRTLKDSGYAKSVGNRCRKVFAAVNGQIRLSLEQGLLQSSGKKTAPLQFP